MDSTSYVYLEKITNLKESVTNNYFYSNSFKDKTIENEYLFSIKEKPIYAIIMCIITFIYYSAGIGFSFQKTGISILFYLFIFSITLDIIFTVLL